MSGSEGNGLTFDEALRGPAEPVGGAPDTREQKAQLTPAAARSMGRPAGNGAASSRALGRVFARLDAVLDSEREVLEQGRMGELDEVAQRKSQCLLDLTRLSRGLNAEALAAGEGGEAFTRELVRIRSRLADNEAMLKRYVDAAREVASLVADGLRAAESDGTYTESGPFGRYGR